MKKGGREGRYKGGREGRMETEREGEKEEDRGGKKISQKNLQTTQCGTHSNVSYCATNHPPVLPRP